MTWLRHRVSEAVVLQIEPDEAAEETAERVRDALGPQKIEASSRRFARVERHADGGARSGAGVDAAAEAGAGLTTQRDRRNEVGVARTAVRRTPR